MFFDGASFIDMDGTRSSDHPDLASALDELLCKRNAAAAKYNEEVERVLTQFSNEAKAYLSSLETSSSEFIEVD